MTLLDDNGSWVNWEEYYPFGETSLGSYAKKRYRFTGKERDEESGLYYYGARYYAPWLCRFISCDPMKEERAWLTPYNYVQNNPINLTDPTGALDDGDGKKNGSATIAANGQEKNAAPASTTAVNNIIPIPLMDKNSSTKSDNSINSSSKPTLQPNTKTSIVNNKFQTLGISKNIPTSNKTIGTDQNKSVLNPAKPSANVQSEKSGQIGGGIDFSNSSLALDIGGGIYGGLQGLTSSQGYWLGKNGKYYSNSWGGNQYTGGRSGAFKAASNYKLAGRATVFVSALIGIYNTRAGYQMDGGQFGYNAQMAAASSAGSILGGWAGAKGGALIGAGIGAWFGGFGAIPGAVIGGVIGGFGFGMAGGYYGGQLGGNAVNYLHEH